MKGEGVKILKGKFLADSKVISLSEALKPSPLEEKYLSLYGQELVDDLKRSYYWMRREIEKQPPREEIVARRRKTPHKIGDRISVCFIDFRREKLYTMSIDEFGTKTVSDYGRADRLNIDNGDNLRFLLSGMYFYDREKMIGYLHGFLGKDAKCWCRRE